jgi:hypothetical protein
MITRIQWCEQCQTEVHTTPCPFCESRAVIFRDVPADPVQTTERAHKPKAKLVAAPREVILAQMAQWRQTQSLS